MSGFSSFIAGALGGFYFTHSTNNIAMDTFACKYFVA
jgi:hypothetical protein